MQANADQLAHEVSLKVFEMAGGVGDPPQPLWIWKPSLCQRNNNQTKHTHGQTDIMNECVDQAQDVPVISES